MAEGHVWSDVYDGEARDVIDLQDEITRQVVASILRLAFTRPGPTRVLLGLILSAEGGLDTILAQLVHQPKLDMERRPKADPAFVEQLSGQLLGQLL